MTRATAFPGPFAVALALALGAPPAAAFCRTTTCGVSNPPPSCVVPPFGACYTTGTPLFWEQACVSFVIQWNGSPRNGISYADAAPVVREAFWLWPNATCLDGVPSITVEDLGPSYCTKPEFNPEGPNANAVIFVDSGWPADKLSAVALTTVSFSPTTGRIYSADIEVNSENFTLAAAQLKQVLAHEAGHFLGLDHTDLPREEDAIMFRSYDFGVSGLDATLKPDDIAAICATYPPSRVTAACNPEPERGFSPDCGGDVEASCGFAVRPGRSPARIGLAALIGMSVLVGLGLRRRGPRRSRERHKSARRAADL